MDKSERQGTYTESIQVLVDGPSDKPEAAVPRHAANLSYMSLTGIVINIPRGAGHSVLTKQWKEADVETKWSNSSFQKSRERSIRRKQLNDFERFKVTRLRKQVCHTGACKASRSPELRCNAPFLGV